MKLKLLLPLLLSVWSFCQAQVAEPEPSQTTNSEKASHSQRTTVTTTSRGKTTVKRTVTIVNGVKKVIVETTDENGKTIREESGTEPAPKTPAPWLGLRVGEVSKVLRDQLGLSEDEGLVVELLAEDGPASQAGIQVRDLLLTFAQKPIASSEELSKKLSTHQVGDDIKVMIMRKGKRLELTVKLQSPPIVQKGKDGKALKELLKEFDLDSKESQALKVEVANAGTGIEAILNDPDLPESFKESVRAIQKALQEVEKKSE